MTEQGRGAVRTRGFIAARGGENGEVEASGAVRAGAVHTRGSGPATIVRPRPWSDLDSTGLRNLLEELREAQDGFPLTIVVEDAAAPAAQAFLGVLQTGDVLGSQDIVWAIGTMAYAEMPTEVRQLVGADAYLQVSQGPGESRLDGQRTAFLSPDMAFITGGNGLDARVGRWADQAWALVVATREALPHECEALAMKLDEPGWMRRWNP